MALGVRAQYALPSFDLCKTSNGFTKKFNQTPVMNIL